MVFAGKERDKVVVVPEAALAAACTKPVGKPAAIVRVSVALPVPPALLALSVTVEVPAEVGVPEIDPLVLLTASPAGNPVAP